MSEVTSTEFVAEPVPTAPIPSWAGSLVRNYRTELKANDKVTDAMIFAAEVKYASYDQDIKPSLIGHYIIDNGWATAEDMPGFVALEGDE